MTSVRFQRMAPDRLRAGSPDGALRQIVRDGALGSRGAALLAPYSISLTSTACCSCRISTWSARSRRRWVPDTGQCARDRRCRQPAGARWFRSGLQSGGRPRAAQSDRARAVVAPADIPRFKQLNLIASMQPTHATATRTWRSIASVLNGSRVRTPGAPFSTRARVLRAVRIFPSSPTTRSSDCTRRSRARIMMASHRAAGTRSRP